MRLMSIASGSSGNCIYVGDKDTHLLIDAGISKKRIEEGKIDTWSCDKDGDFTHNVDQWRFHAWMRSFVESERVVFGVVGRKDKNLSVLDYAVYHGRFVEMLLRHFDKDCSDISVSPLGTKYDLIQTSNNKE